MLNAFPRVAWVSSFYLHPLWSQLFLSFLVFNTYLSVSTIILHLFFNLSLFLQLYLPPVFLFHSSRFLFLSSLATLNHPFLQRVCVSNEPYTNNFKLILPASFFLCMFSCFFGSPLHFHLSSFLFLSLSIPPPPTHIHTPSSPFPHTAGVLSC